MKFTDQYPVPTGSLAKINDKYLAAEQPLVQQLLDIADIGEQGRARIGQQAEALVRAVRKNTDKDGGIDAFLQQYDLSSQEGVLLMSLAPRSRPPTGRITLVQATPCSLTRRRGA